MLMRMKYTNTEKYSTRTDQNRNEKLLYQGRMCDLKTFQLLLITVALVSGKHGTFKCKFGRVTSSIENAGVSNNSSSVRIEQILPGTVRESHVCEASTLNQHSFLLIKATTTEANNGGALHVLVFTTAGALKGHMDVSNSIGESRGSIQLCPEHPKSHNIDQSHQIVFSGTPSLPYTVEMAYTDQSIKLNDQKDFTLTRAMKEKIYIFEAPENITSAQLEITVTSNSNVSAYLTVSPICSNVAQHKIDRVLGDGTQTMRLSFSRKGRITLSLVSDPKLESGKAWYIGVELKYASAEDTSDTSKEVTLSLNMGFNYDYAGPVWFIVSVPLVLGMLVALIACKFFRESQLFSDGSDEEVPILVGNKNQDIPSKCEILRAMFARKFLLCWFRHGPKTFSYVTLIVGCVLFVGSFQFVYGKWTVMVDTGDRDKCYYNDFCYRVRHGDIPYNLMISNVAYMIHGGILAIFVWAMEAQLWVWSKRLANATRSKQVPLGHAGSGSQDHRVTGSEHQVQNIPNHLLKCYNITAHMPSLTVPEPDLSITDSIQVEIYTNALKRRVSYSIGYAFAWALFFEGVFSLTYHLCPTRMTFQFDTAFMFVIAGLIVLSLFNGFSVRACEETKPVDAAKFFLFVMVPLYIFNYVGSIYSLHYYTMGSTWKILFLICLCSWYVCIVVWTVYKFNFNYRQPCEILSDYKEIIKVVSILIMLCISIYLLVTDWKSNDVSNLFLYVCICASIISILGKILITLCQSNCNTCQDMCQCKRLLKCVYVLATVAVLGWAVYVFVYLPTTDKGLTPEESRNKNQECCLLGFYDHHDVWHLISSFALLMGAFAVMFASERFPQDLKILKYTELGLVRTIRVFERETLYS